MRIPGTVILIFILAMARSGAHPVADSMALAANDFIHSLDAEQRAKAVFALEDEHRVNWHYVPLERKGLAMGEMRPDQQHLAHGLLSTGLSHDGYLKAVQIMSLERILWELENQSPRRDPAYYLVSIFGKPEAGGSWGWRFEGHHLSLSFTIVGGELIAETPAFFAANPGEVKQGPRAGLRVLSREEDLGRKLIQSLDDSQRGAAVIAGKAPKDIVTVDLPRVNALPPEGIAYPALRPDQQAALRELIDVYLNRHRAELAAEERKRVEAELAELRFAWAGGFEFGEGHYYRVQGRSFLLEYCNIQNGAMHPHTVWRNFGEDFGRDFLREHVKGAHPQ